MKKIFQLVSITSISFLILTSFATAKYRTISSEDLDLDPELIIDTKEFNMPESIILIPITPPEDSLLVDPIDWYNGILYYQTSRYNLPSISFHYVITPDGSLIDNELLNPDRKVDIESGKILNPIYIAYFTESGSIGFNPAIRAIIAEILTELANKNAILLENIHIKGIEFSEDSDRTLITDIEDVYIGWENDLLKIIELIKPNYQPVERTYYIEVVNSPEMPVKELEAGSISEGKIKVKNVGEFPIYQDSESELLFTKLDEEEKSIYFSESKWATQTQVPLIQESSIFKPGEEQELKFSIQVPLDFGEVSEEFKIMNRNGILLDNGPYNVAITVKQPEGDFIEVIETDTGYLNVRSEASIGAELVTRISPGERYKELDRKSGWVQIELGEGKEGWVYGPYVKKI